MIYDISGKALNQGTAEINNIFYAVRANCTTLRPQTLFMPTITKPTKSPALNTLRTFGASSVSFFL